MDKLTWCLKQKDGISLVEPNSNLAEAYIKKAEEALKSMRVNIVKDWEISTAYYTMYFSLYSILMKIGVKCEIHSCTLEFAKYFLNEHFNEDELDFLSDSLKARVDSQYYVNREISDEQYQSMIKKAPEFLIKCKSVLLQLDEKSINEVRNRLKDKFKNIATHKNN